MQEAPDSLSGQQAGAQVDSVESSLGLMDRGNELLVEFGNTLWGKALTILVIILLARLLIFFVDRSTRFFEEQYSDRHDLDADKQRARTISHLFSSVVRYIAWPLATIVILDEVGIDVGALIATAGIAGLAIGFGAQTLVKDVISGIFLLFDDSISVGDTIRFGDQQGVIEDIGVRLVRIRKYNGELLMIPSGELRVFSNMSRDYARAIVEVGVGYKQNLDVVMPVVDRVASDWAKDNPDILLEDEPQVQAATRFGESTFKVRIAAKVTPGNQYSAERDIRVRLKKAFDRNGIQLAIPSRVVYTETLPQQD